MGYCVEATIEGLVIKAENVKRAIEALSALMGEVDVRGNGGSSRNGVMTRHFSWVDTSGVLLSLRRGELDGAFKEWRYAVRKVERTDLEQLASPDSAPYDIVVDWFEGEKFGDDDALWDALAPFVEEGGSIEWRGEDNAMWRYVFEGGCCVEQTARIIWE